MNTTGNSTGGIIAKGAFVNILGAAGKGLIPVYFIMITRMYGPETMGLFYMIYVMVDMAVSLTVSGLNDGVVMFTSRFGASGDKESNVYDIIANGFVISLAISVIIIVLAYFGGPELILMKYPDKNVVNSVQSIVWSLPFVVIPVIVVSATKSHLTMKWDAILLGFLRSFALIIFSVLFYFTGTGLDGLIWAFNISAVVVTAVSLVVFGFYFDYGKLIRAVLSFRISMPLVKFSIPQNLNMTFNTFITNVDVVMLGFFGVAPQIIAFYGMGSQIVRAIRQVKLAFSGSYSPVIARMYGQGDIEKMNFSFSMVSRWTTMISFPVSLIVIMFRNELLRLFHPSFTSDTTFMLLLLAPPLLSCMVGMAGNIIVMTGNSLWNLINSMTIAVVNAYLNWLFIPYWGIMGAATATLIASLLVSVMQLVEAYYLTGARLIPDKIYKPYFAMIIPVLLLTFLSYYVSVEAFAVKLVLAVFLVFLYILLLTALKFEPEDKEIFVKKGLFKRRSDENG